jgi:hypothetical protein
VGTNLPIALLAAALAAAVFAVSAVLQQRAARGAPDRESLSPDFSGSFANMLVEGS